MTISRVVSIPTLVLRVFLGVLCYTTLSEVVALAQANSSDNPISIGPYVQNVGCQRAVLCWATLDGQSKVTGPNGEVTFPRYNVHELLLAKLSPNTTYHYDVLGDGSDAGKGSFTTFPQQIAPFRFVVVGDTRSRHETHQAIVDRIIPEKPLFVVNTGDLVSDGLNMEDWKEFFRINHTLMRDVPYYPVLGNHEKDSPFYFDFFSLPQNERYYEFSVGNALFLFLDVEGSDFEPPAYMDFPAKVTWWKNRNLEYMKQQKAWVENTLTLHESAGYIFVFLHEPLISVQRSRLEFAKMWREFWDGMFEKHRVSVIFTGHDHHYHHAVVDRTHHITTAGGGAGLYNPDTPAPETVLLKKVNHFCRVDIGKDDATVTAVEIDGSVIEKVSLARRH